MVFSIFVVTWVMPKGVLELLAYWSGQQGNISAKEVWRIVPLCVMWIFFFFFFDKSEEFISKSANLKGASPNYTKSITKNA
jgi:hypothetical protein